MKDFCHFGFYNYEDECDKDPEMIRKSSNLTQDRIKDEKQGNTQEKKNESLNDEKSKDLSLECKNMDCRCKTRKKEKGK